MGKKFKQQLINSISTATAILIIGVSIAFASIAQRVKGAI